MTAFQPARLRALLFAILAVTLAGCATNQAFEDGKKALISGEQERALSLFEQATKEAPDNPEFRATFFRQREVAVSKLLAQAENARLAGRRDEATAALDKAQTLDPRNQRAQVIRDQRPRYLDDVLTNVSGITQGNTLAGTQDTVLKRGFGGNREEGIRTVEELLAKLGL